MNSTLEEEKYRRGLCCMSVNTVQVTEFWYNDIIRMTGLGRSFKKNIAGEVVKILCWYLFRDVYSIFNIFK